MREPLPSRSRNNASQSIRGLIITAVVGLVMVIAIAFGCRSSGGFSFPSVPTGQMPTVVPIEDRFLPNDLAIYFTDPNPPDNLGQSIIDRQVQPALNAAATSIDATSFDLNLPGVVNALAAASLRGVKVRVVYDGLNGNLELDNAATDYRVFNAIRTMKASGVALVDAGRESGLMHNKMIIIDGKTLFVGSWNLSYNDTYRNNNNLLKITNPRLIANYQAKFEELFTDQRFGADARVKVPNPIVTLDSVRVENYFAPTDDVMDKLVSYVHNADQSVHFMIFTFTSRDLSDELIARWKTGLDIQGVIESRGASQGVLASLYCAGLPVRTDGNPYTMHHKVLIIDSKIVVTGSFNFTRAADTINDDNVLIIHSPAAAIMFEREYQRIMSDAKTPQVSELTCPRD